MFAGEYGEVNIPMKPTLTTPSDRISVYQLFRNRYAAWSLGRINTINKSLFLPIIAYTHNPTVI